MYTFIYHLGANSIVPSSRARSLSSPPTPLKDCVPAVHARGPECKWYSPRDICLSRLSKRSASRVYYRSSIKKDARCEVRLTSKAYRQCLRDLSFKTPCAVTWLRRLEWLCPSLRRAHCLLILELRIANQTIGEYSSTSFLKVGKSGWSSG